MRTSTRSVSQLVLRLLCVVAISFSALAWIEYRVAAQAQEALAAKAPFRLPFQGRLLKPDGNPVVPGNPDVLFSIYDTAVGGSALWSSGLVQVAVKKGGLFNTALEAGNPALNTLDFTETLYVGVRVDDPNNAESLANEPEMLPRILITPGVYSHQSGVLGGSPKGFLATSVEIVPIGTVTTWFGNPAELPQNWLSCNGQTVNDRESSLDGLSVPDLRNAFARGDGNTERNLLTFAPGAGGAEMAEVSIPDHIHGISMAEAGEHSHSTTSAAGGHQHETTIVGDDAGFTMVKQSPPPFGFGSTITGNFHAFLGNSGRPMKTHLTSTAGEHTHGTARAGTHYLQQFLVVREPTKPCSPWYHPMWHCTT